MKYEIIVAGTVIAKATSRKEANELLEQAKRGFLAIVHPQNVFRIKEVSD